MCKKQDNRSTTRLIRYICDNASRKKVGSLEYKCENHKTIREEILENYLLDNLREVSQNFIRQNSIVQTKNNNTDNSSKISEIKRKMYKLKDLYLDDLIDKETYKNDYKKLEDKLNELQIKDTPYIKKDFSKLQKIINLDFCKIYASLSIEEKRFFWLQIIDKIYIEHGQIKEVTFL